MCCPSVWSGSVISSSRIAEGQLRHTSQHANMPVCHGPRDHLKAWEAEAELLWCGRYRSGSKQIKDGCSAEDLRGCCSWRSLAKKISDTVWGYCKSGVVCKVAGKACMQSNVNSWWWLSRRFLVVSSLGHPIHVSDPALSAARWQPTSSHPSSTTAFGMLCLFGIIIWPLSKTQLKGRLGGVRSKVWRTKLGDIMPIN